MGILKFSVSAGLCFHKTLVGLYWSYTKKKKDMRSYLYQGLFISTIFNNMLYLYLLPMNIIEISILFPFFFPWNTKFKTVLFQPFKSTQQLEDISVLLSFYSNLWSTISTYIQCTLLSHNSPSQLLGERILSSGIFPGRTLCALSEFFLCGFDRRRTPLALLSSPRYVL